MRSKRIRSASAARPLSSAELTSNDLLVQQRDRRPMGTAVFLGQLRAALRQVQHHLGRYVLEVGEAGFRRQTRPATPSPSRSPDRRSPKAVHRRPGRAPMRLRRPTCRRAAPCRPPRGWPTRRNPLPPRPSAIPARSGAESDDRGIVEAHRVIDERSQIRAVGSHGVRTQPQSALGYRIHRCRYSR